MDISFFRMATVYNKYNVNIEEGVIKRVGSMFSCKTNHI